jgi:hypothetical protein
VTLIDDIPLYEGVLLLALRDREGTICPGKHCAWAIAGAILGELILKNRIDVEQEDQKHFVRLLSSSPIGDRLVDECLSEVTCATEVRSLRSWLLHFSHLKNLKHRVAQQLCKRRILREDRGDFLHVFHRKIYPEIDHNPEALLIESLGRAAFSPASPPAPRIMVLLAITFSTGLLGLVLNEVRLLERKAEIERQIRSQKISKAIYQSITSIEAASSFFPTA